MTQPAAIMFQGTGSDVGKSLSLQGLVTSRKYYALQSSYAH